MMTHTAPPARVFDKEVEAVRDDLERDYSGWWCVSTDPWPCPAEGCDVVVEHLTVAHLILVWPRRDDPQMLDVANDAQQLHRNPRVVEYEPQRGPCIPYDVWWRIGRPVHGIARRPAGKPYREI